MARDPLTYTLFIGAQGDADCCLGLLENETNHAKQFLIDTAAWRILDKYYNAGHIRPIPDWLAEIVFYDMEFDEVEELEQLGEEYEDA